MRLIIFSLLGIFLVGCQSNGICVTEMNCFINQKQRLCGNNYYIAVDTNPAGEIAICRAYGYEIDKGILPRDAKANRKKLMKGLENGQFKAMGWTRQEIERRAAAGICAASETPAGCKPWSAEAVFDRRR